MSYVQLNVLLSIHSYLFNSSLRSHCLLRNWQFKTKSVPPPKPSPGWTFLVFSKLSPITFALVTFWTALLRSRHMIPSLALPVQLYHYTHCSAFINEDHSHPSNLNYVHVCSPKLLLKWHNLPFENTCLAVSFGDMNTQVKSTEFT